jgi:hypothetical protein
MGGGVALLEGRLHFMAGATTDGAGKEMYVDKTTHWALALGSLAAGWQRRADVPAGRNHMAAVSHGGRIYTLGGQLMRREGCTNQRAVEAYDPGLDRWSTLAPMPRGRGHIAASTLSVPKRGILVVGGVGDTPAAPDQRHTCEPPGVKHPDGLFYGGAADGWTSVRGLPEGASMVCGLFPPRGVVQHLCCQRADEVIVTRLRWAPVAKTPASPGLAMAKERQLHAQLASWWQAHFRAAEAKVNISELCTTFAETEQAEGLDALLAMLRTFSLRRELGSLDKNKGIRWRDEHPFLWMLWHWFGVCMAWRRKDSTDAVLDAWIAWERYEKEEHQSCAPLEWFQWVSALNRAPTSELSCAFLRRDMHASVLHGAVWTALLGVPKDAMASQAAHLCNRNTSQGLGSGDREVVALSRHAADCWHAAGHGVFYSELPQDLPLAGREIQWMPGSFTPSNGLGLALPDALPGRAKAACEVLDKWVDSRYTNSPCISAAMHSLEVHTQSRAGHEWWKPFLPGVWTPLLTAEPFHAPCAPLRAD